MLAWFIIGLLTGKSYEYATKTDERISNAVEPTY